MPTKSKSHIAADIGMFAAGAVAATAGALFLYGKNAKRNRRVIRGWTMKIKGEVVDELERMREVDQKVYHRLVDDIAAKYARLPHIDTKDVEKAAKELKSHWKHISTSLAKNMLPRGKRKIIRKK